MKMNRKALRAAMALAASPVGWIAVGLTEVHAADWYTGAPSAAPAAPASWSGTAPGSISGWGARPVDNSVSEPIRAQASRPSGSRGYYAETGSGLNKTSVAVDVSLAGDTKGSKFATVIGTIAPFGGFERSGLRLRLAGVIGDYAYIGSNGIGRVHGTQHDGSFMVGYEWVSQRLTVAVYAGANYNDNKLDKDDPNNGAQGRTTGAKIAADFFYTPTDRTMFSGVASYSSAHSAYYGRLKMGWAILQGLYVGPEALVLGDDYFSQWRIGGHFTGARVGPLQLGASGGFLFDRVRGTGLYGMIDGRIQF